MPASRAVCSGSPFLTAPARIWRRASADIVIDPRAIASRVVTGLSPPSTLSTRPRASTCDSTALSDASDRPDPPGPPDPPDLFGFGIALREEERQVLERDSEVDALQLHVRRHLQRAGREVQHRLDAGSDDKVEDVLRGWRRHRDHRDADAFLARDFLQIVDVVDRHAAARLLSHFLAEVVEQRRNLEAFVAESGIVGEREAEVSRAHDRNAQPAIESEDLPEM